MSTKNNLKLVESAVMVIEASQLLRKLTRAIIATLCVAAVFCFLYNPDLSGFVTFPLPLLVIGFSFLRILGKLAHSNLLYRGCASQRRRARRFIRSVVSASDFMLKAIAALILSGTVLIASTLDFTLLGIVAATTLLLATLIDKPYHGLFADASDDERKERLRRQTRESLSIAVLESGLAPQFAGESIDRREWPVVDVDAAFHSADAWHTVRANRAEGGAQNHLHAKHLYPKINC